MIDQIEIDNAAKKFGTPHNQILRDHLISQTWTLASEQLDIKVQFAEWRFRWQETIPTVRIGVQLRYSDLLAASSLYRLAITISKQTRIGNARCKLKPRSAALEASASVAQPWP